MRIGYYRTMHPAQTAARGMSSLQYVRTKFSALISHGMRTASIHELATFDLLSRVPLSKLSMRQIASNTLIH